MGRYLKIYWLFIRQSFIREMQFRGNFVMDNIITLGWSVMRIIFYSVTFSHIITVGEWTYERSLVLSGVFLFVHSIQKGLFEENFAHFAQNLYRGEFDVILLKPLSAQFVVSLREFTSRSLIRMIIGMVILVSTLVYIGWDFTWMKAGLFIWAVGISLLIMYSLQFVTLCLAFWIGNINNIHQLMRPFISMTYLPIDVFITPIKELLTFMVPIVFIATIPAQVLLGLDARLLGIGTILAGSFLLLARWTWHQGLKAYTSVSS